MKSIGLFALLLAGIDIPNASGFSTARKATTTKLTMSSSEAATQLSNSDHILFDMPVSNNGARVRAILYHKQLSQQQVDIISPMKLGGLKSEEFMALSPQGLMPALTIQKEHASGMKHLSESDTIARYLLAEYAGMGPSFQPDNPRSNQICRWHDVYLTTIQGCLYKPASRFPVGDYADRKSAIRAFQKNLKVIEGFMSGEGMYLCGDEVSLADASLFPTCIFAKYMLPKFDDSEPPLPPKLNAWFDNLRMKDSVFSKIYDEIMDTLVTSWEEKNHRWDSIWLAGQRDEAPGTIFDKIIAKEIPATIVKEDEHILAFKDINPVSPAHVLIIPKDRNGLTNLRKASAEHTDILGKMLVAAGEIANDAELGFGDGARFVINDGNDGGQEVYHLHLHVLGGRKLGPMG
eukprot:scaffold555_cov158-Skeletonema_menzelii.AAC.23